MALTREQRAIARAIIHIGHKRGATHKMIVSALETGLVESNLRNLRGGSDDSQGWRQERASLYPNPRNLRASINRYYNEAAARRHRAGSAGQLAAMVQRPAAQYRGRYQLQRGRALSILNAFNSGRIPGGGSPGAGGGGSRVVGGYAGGSTSVGGINVPLGQPARSAGIASLIAQMEQPQPTPTSALPDPAFSARNRLAMPQGYQEAPSSGAPVSQQSNIKELLAAVQPAAGSGSLRVGGRAVGFAGRGGFRVPTGGGGGGGGGRVPGSAGARRQRYVAGGGWGGTQKLFWTVDSIAKAHGLRPGSRKRASSTTDHGLMNKWSFATDYPTFHGRRFATDIARSLGASYHPGSWNKSIVRIGRHRYRVQILWQAPDGSHHDHVHVGIRRVS